ncbi:Lysophospholipase L1 [Polaromonas sp. OV174]|uniref:GDSL-type esterase/lipase family protein n=1 Tax=Polaromonas sp. OV174 TaxID=1855300 RepID=UPI0008E78296|nr:GDSL-type esterase/lipase family protein [Polaromonas sp. OV174]SFC48137.1 Lysophospholipase L1 [Polaromonas sp. OV174]
MPHPLRRRLLLGGLSATLLLAGGCSRSAKPQGKTLAKDATLLCLGDSLTYGYGAAAGSSYPQRLEQLSGHVTQNAGLNGDTAQGALARLPGLLQESRPGLVLVSIGGNDFLRGLPLERTRAALKTLLQTAAGSAQVVLLAQPKPVLLAAASGTLKDHELYADLAQETGTALFAEGWSYVLSRAELRSDPIHANAQGYEVFAERLDQWLRKMKFVG